jgi:hypothetical protein
MSNAAATDFVVHDFVHRRRAYSGLCGSCVRTCAYRSTPPRLQLSESKWVRNTRENSPADTSSHCALVDGVLPGAQRLLWCVCRKGSVGEGRWFFGDRNVSKPYLFWPLGLAFERKADAPSRHFAGKKRQGVTTIRPVRAGRSTSS